MERFECLGELVVLRVAIADPFHQLTSTERRRIETLNRDWQDWTNSHDAAVIFLEEQRLSNLFRAAAARSKSSRQLAWAEANALSSDGGSRSQVASEAACEPASELDQTALVTSLPKAALPFRKGAARMHRSNRPSAAAPEPHGEVADQPSGAVEDGGLKSSNPCDQTDVYDGDGKEIWPFAPRENGGNK